jgi:arylsulfatase A-like enzyme
MSKDKTTNSNKPNILWIVMDHVTFRHYKLTKGARPILNTYNRIASQGVEFINCHSVHPLCLPARASMMTGMYSHHHGKVNNGNHADAGYPLFNEYLEKEGYKIGYFGKNHSGYEDLEKRGFEGYYPKDYGNPYRTKEYREYLDKNGLDNPIYHQEWAVIHNYENGDYDLTQIPNFNTYSAGYFKTPGPVHEADFLVSTALDWMDERIEEGNSFALRVDTWGPHHAFQVPLEYKDTINAAEIEEYPSFKVDMKNRPEFVQDFLQNLRNNNKLKTWEEWQPVVKRAYENYSYIDAAVGRLLDKLEEKGEADNTIVICTADHGDALASHGGMVDKAGDMMEELMHIPMVISWPGVTKGTICNELVSNLDLVPTVLEMAGVEAPKYMDGMNMVSLLKGESTGWREDFMAEHYGHFKIHAAQRALYYKEYKYVVTDGYISELYNLQEDPFELNNLVDAPSAKDILKEMKRRLLDNMDRYEDKASDIEGLRTSIIK